MKKRGALELSVGTMIIIVLALTMLILGMIFVRSIMCSGIVLTEEISRSMENEVKNLFGAREYGVKCMGEGGQEVRLATGGRRAFACIINTPTGGRYNLEVTGVEDITTKADRSDLIADETPEWDVGTDPTTATVAVLNLPRGTPETTLKISILETDPNGVSKTHISYVDITPAGAFTAAIC